MILELRVRQEPLELVDSPVEMGQQGIQVVADVLESQEKMDLRGKV